MFVLDFVIIQCNDLSKKFVILLNVLGYHRLSSTLKIDRIYGFFPMKHHCLSSVI